ncbi:type II toxin-antitoxin system RelE/ParE family toxin [Dyadobacter arcticus]|uniref:Plasmid stabilization system protein ParE n=1 Tax=Dyadobacter arcticus TaxID=1078754 RepID=A0ABX0UT03_9BACT|nr:type II toxin-antitoxin system RelE/ParE family toxin [Dyadobacter arcticus]NIJ55349.1 plasmid stabilization system protein ParE [Dyadobacter arcticus]
MALEIIWSPRALDNFHDIIAYLEETWSEQVTKAFVERTEKLLALIAKHPRIYRQISQKNSVREALITKHNFLIYKIYLDRIALLAVFDTRKHPKKTKIFFKPKR